MRGQVLLLGAQARGVVREVRVGRGARRLCAAGGRAGADARAPRPVRLAARIASTALHIELQTHTTVQLQTLHLTHGGRLRSMDLRFLWAN